jgi:hypothetical protein
MKDNHKMRITRRQLRQIIRESILEERKGASASDIARFKPQLLEWTEILIDELAEAVPAMKEISEKARTNMVKNLADKVSVALVGLTSSMGMDTQKRLEKRSEEQAHQKWDNARKARSGNVQYLGDWGA